MGASLHSSTVQPLEPRRLLAVTVSLVSGKLTVTGTDGADYVALQPDYNFSDDVSRVDVFTRRSGGPTATFRSDQIRSVFVDTKDGNDEISVDEGVELTRSSPDPVTLRGGNGDDEIDDFSGSGNTLVDGQGGNDTLVGGDTLRAGTGNDKIYGSVNQGDIGSDNYIDAGDGNDTIDGDGGSDTIYGQAGNDRIYADQHLDDAYDHAYSVIDAGTGDDRVDLSAAATVHLGVGNDTLAFLDDGVDRYEPISGGVIYGDAGNDVVTMKYTASPAAGRVFAVHGGDGNDKLTGDSGHTAVEHFYGDAGRDTLTGGAGNDVLYGGADDDSLVGAAGYDRFYGEAGHDHVSAKDGMTDTIYGTDGGDVLTRDSFDVLAH